MDKLLIHIDAAATEITDFLQLKFLRKNGRETTV
jgi:hypothetical protein